MLIRNLLPACGIPQMKSETSYLRFICDAAFGGLACATNDIFLKMLIMNNKDIYFHAAARSHFVRNDGVSPSDGWWKSGGWSLSEVEVAATFPPTDDTHGVSFRPQGDLGDRRRQPRSEPAKPNLIKMYVVFNQLFIAIQEKYRVRA